MDNLCLNKSEIENLITFSFDNVTDDLENDIYHNFRRSLEWDLRIISCNGLFSELLEKRLKNNTECSSIIDNYYSLSDIMFLTIEEFNRNFIEYLMKYKLPKGSLEEDLINALEDYHAKIYY